MTRRRAVAPSDAATASAATVSASPAVAPLSHSTSSASSTSSTSSTHSDADLLLDPGTVCSAEIMQQLRASPGRGMKSGDVVERDWRRKDGSVEKEDPSRPLRLLQWNIERGYRLPQILSLLRSQNADIISLQEIDIGCARSEWKDTGEEIARELGMNYAFVCEFEELYSGVRDENAQGGGVHGNAILSRYEMKNTRTIEHTPSFDWERDGHTKREPRRGRRYTLATDVITPSGPLTVYSAHFEVFTGIQSRIRSYDEIISDARVSKVQHQAILGDFNTLSHGIARLSSSYCNDWLRLGSLGYTEAEWFVATHLHSSHRNELGFYDPFDCYTDVTLNNYSDWFQGKLDWMLLRNLSHGRTWIANGGYEASDHKLLGCEVEFEEAEGNDEATVAHKQPDAAAMKKRRHRHSRRSSAELKRLMPLRRWRPGIITSSATHPRIYLTQIGVFCLTIALLAYLAFL